MLISRRRRVMSWRRVGKSVQALVAHALLFSFTLLLSLKLQRALPYSWWFVFFPFFFAFSMLAKTCYYWYCFQSGCWQSGIRKILLESIWVLKDWFFAFMCWFNLCIYDVSRRELLINVVKLIETLGVVCKIVSLFVFVLVACTDFIDSDFWFLWNLFYLVLYGWIFLSLWF